MMTAAANYQLGFLGAGRMATALARGVISAGLADARAVVASDPAGDAARRFAEDTGARTVETNETVVRESRVVVLAVKPQVVGEVAGQVRAALTAEHLLVSLAAGVPLSALAAAFGPKPRLARVMPNTPCLIGRGASAFCLGPGAAEDDDQTVQRLLASVGLAMQVDEKLMDAVTGLSGSGPAYGYLMIEALSDGGVRMGLPREVATALAAQTLAGAAQMVLETGQHPGALKDQVTSPAGTTISGLQKLEEHAVRGALISAVQAATQRAAELGQDANCKAKDGKI